MLAPHPLILLPLQTLEAKLERCNHELSCERARVRSLQSDVTQLGQKLEECDKKVAELTLALKEKSSEVRMSKVVAVGYNIEAMWQIQSLKSYIFTKGAETEERCEDSSSCQNRTEEHGEVLVREVRANAGRFQTGFADGMIQDCNGVQDRIRLLEMQLEANQEILKVQDKWMSELERKTTEAGKSCGWKAEETRDVVNEFCTKMVKEWRSQVFAVLLELKARENTYEIEKARLVRQIDEMTDEVG